MLIPGFRYSSLLDAGKHRARAEGLGSSSGLLSWAECSQRQGLCGTEQHMHWDREQAAPLTLTSRHIHITESLMGDACSLHVYLLTYKNDYVTVCDCEVYFIKSLSMSTFFFFFTSSKTSLEASRVDYGIFLLRKKSLKLYLHSKLYTHALGRGKILPLPTAFA